MPFIGTTPTQGFVSSFPKQSFTPNGSTTVFTLTNPVASANDLEVFVGNVRQEPTTAYTAAGTTLTMSEAPNTGLNFYVINKSFAQVTTTPPANSISTDKIINANVTSAKLASTLDLSGTGRTGHGGLKSITVYADAGTHTYTKPTGINTVKVFVTGGGGQGGGYGASNDFGAGGGAGGTAIEIIDVSSLSSTVTVTVGAGGSGAANTADGNAGATSSFGSYCSAAGGNGGRHGNRGDTYGGAGGAATGGNINIEGGAGNNGIDNMVTNGTDYRPTWGIGGASFWGGGGRGGVYNISAATGKAFGSGGGGGATAGNGLGAAGKQGIVVIEEYA